MKTNLNINISGEKHFFYSHIKTKLLRVIIEELLKNTNKKDAEISIVILNDEELKKINKESLNHDYYTDIITFDYTDNMFHVETELLISRDRIADNAKNYGVNISNELIRVIIHGLLHVCGFNDKERKDKEKMTIEENKYLEKYLNYGKI